MDVEEIVAILKEHTAQYDVPVAELVKVQTEDRFKVLVGTMLSAQTKDQTTAKVCERLFSVVDKPSDLKNLSVEEIETLIKSANYHKTKARNIKKLENLEKVPDTFEELVKLPGVGRKTANVVLAVAFKKPAIGVDVHCHRIPQRLGWFTSKTPRETEKKLKKIVPKKYGIDFNYIFVSFGQNLCTPISPHCSKCPIYDHCERRGVKTSR